MKHTKLIIFLVLVLSIAACNAAPSTATATQIPTVVADDTIIAEGKLASSARFYSPKVTKSPRAM
jgi:hypothetical protein